MTNQNESTAQEEDLFRDTPVRYLGYANEIGESFRSMVSVTAVRATYVAAFAYVFADSVDKATKEYKKEHPEKLTKSAIIAADTLAWQAFASVFIPGFAINRICYGANLLLERSTKLPTPIRKWTVTALGLGMIPLIIHPIDTLVENSMNATVRKLYKHE